MEPRCEALCDTLAKRVVEGNFIGAHALFAPWLQARMGPDDIERMVMQAGAGQIAREWTLDEGFLDVGDLGAPGEITGENYRGWLCIQFNPGFDLWLAAVEHGGDYRVGHLEPAETG